MLATCYLFTFKRNQSTFLKNKCIRTFFYFTGGYLEASEKSTPTLLFGFYVYDDKDHGLIYFKLVTHEH